MRKYLEGKEKVSTFAFAFENDASAEAGKAKQNEEFKNFVKTLNKILTVQKLVVTLHHFAVDKPRCFTEARQENIERFQ